MVSTCWKLLVLVHILIPKTCILIAIQNAPFGSINKAFVIFLSLAFLFIHEFRKYVVFVPNSVVPLNIHGTFN